MTPIAFLHSFEEIKKKLPPEENAACGKIQHSEFFWGSNASAPLGACLAPRKQKNHFSFLVTGAFRENKKSGS